MDILTRFTLNINAQTIGPDPEEPLRVLKAWRPPGVFFMNALNCKDETSITQRAFRLLQEWGGFVVYRHYEGNAEAHLWDSYTPAQYFKEVIKPYGCKDIWFAPGNEPAPGSEKSAAKFCAFYEGLIDIALEEGYRLAVPGGMASASIEKWMWDAGWYDSLLLKVARNSHRKINGISQFLWADHMYAHAWLPAHAAGRDLGIMVNPDRARRYRDPGDHPMSLGFPTFKEMFLESDISDNYLIARGHWPIARIRHLRRPELPEGMIDDLGIVVTECIFDRMPNVVTGAPDMVRQIDQIAGREVRGMPTLPRYWEFMRPDQPWEDTACEQLHWIDSDFPPEYLFFALFTWSWNDDAPLHWRRYYNVGDMRTFYLRVPGYYQEHPIKRGRYEDENQPTPEPEIPGGEPVMLDTLDYLRGDGRLYELRNTFPGGGVERVQTQFDPAEPRRWFESKNALWSELWFDDDYIYRGVDTSPGNGEVYELHEGNQYGNRWLPRSIKVGDSFKRTATVIFRRKSDGTVTNSFPHTTWIKVKALHPKYKFQGGLELNDVLELQGFEDVNGTPKGQSFETYFYAKGFGLVGWQGEPGRSYIATLLPSGTNSHEVLPWLTLPALPPLETEPPDDDEPDEPPTQENPPSTPLITLADLHKMRGGVNTVLEALDDAIDRQQKATSNNPA